MSQDGVTLNSEETKPVAIAIIELHLSKDISYVVLVFQSVENSLKTEIFKISYELGGRVYG